MRRDEGAKKRASVAFCLPADMVKRCAHSHSLPFSLSLGYRFVKKAQRALFARSPPLRKKQNEEMGEAEPSPVGEGYASCFLLAEGVKICEHIDAAAQAPLREGGREP